MAKWFAVGTRFDSRGGGGLFAQLSRSRPFNGALPVRSNANLRGEIQMIPESVNKK